jgi:hypothetical protein
MYRQEGSRSNPFGDMKAKTHEFGGKEETLRGGKQEPALGAKKEPAGNTTGNQQSGYPAKDASFRATNGGKQEQQAGNIGGKSEYRESNRHVINDAGMAPSMARINSGNDLDKSAGHVRGNKTQTQTQNQHRQYKDAEVNSPRARSQKPTDHGFGHVQEPRPPSAPQIRNQAPGRDHVRAKTASSPRERRLSLPHDNMPQSESEIVHTDEKTDAMPPSNPDHENDHGAGKKDSGKDDGDTLGYLSKDKVKEFIQQLPWVCDGRVHVGADLITVLKKREYGLQVRVCMYVCMYVCIMACVYVTHLERI